MTDLHARIERFLAAPAFAVVGASADPEKYGHKVLRCYLQKGRRAFAINPRGGEILGKPVYPDLSSLPEQIKAISVITPPRVTDQVVAQAIAAGVEHVWMQPGAESEAAVEMAESAGINVISGGACVLVVLGYREGR